MPSCLHTLQWQSGCSLGLGLTRYTLQFADDVLLELLDLVWRHAISLGDDRDHHDLHYETYTMQSMIHHQRIRSDCDLATCR